MKDETELLAKAAGARQLPVAEPSPAACCLPLVATGGIVVGVLLALEDAGDTAIVRIAGVESDAALRVRCAIDLDASHLGSSIVLMFENGDPTLPIATGRLRGARTAPPSIDDQCTVVVEDDGKTTILRAMNRLVLRCGKASITLTKAGKVLIEGEYVCTSSTGLQRIRGASVQIN